MSRNSTPRPFGARGRILVLALAGAVAAGCPDGDIETCPGGTCADAGNSDTRPVDIAATPDTGDGPLPGDITPPGKFKKGHVFIAGSRNAEIFELDPLLKLVSRWTHPKFGKVLPAPGQPLSKGPAGMVFDAHGYLVVAAYEDFCVFSAPNVLVKCHKKVKAQATENIIFDKLSNLYTTTATGGTNEIHKYDKSYKFVTTFSMPTGNLTGVTCDPTGDLFIASQTGSSGIIYKVDKKTLKVLDKITVPGNLEGLQYTKGGGIWVASFGGGYGLRHINATSPLSVNTTIKDPGMYGPVPVTIDKDGNLYTADYENGSGTAPADVFVYDSAGKLKASSRPSKIYGPFGVVVAGTVLPCGAYRIK